MTGRQAIAVYGKTRQGSRLTGAPARHIMAACDQVMGVALASTDLVPGAAARMTTAGLTTVGLPRLRPQAGLPLGARNR